MRRLLVAMAVTLSALQALQAQPRITLVHGAGKDSSDWFPSTLSYYANRFPQTILTPPPTTYGTNLAEKLSWLRYRVGSFADSTALAGFSLGGVLSRELVGDAIPPMGVVTFNSPVSGLPFANTLGNLEDHLTWTTFMVADVFLANLYYNLQIGGGGGGGPGGGGGGGGADPNWFTWLEFAAFAGAFAYQEGFIGPLGILHAHDGYLDQLSPGSSYLTNLSPGNPAKHFSVVVQQTQNAVWGAPFSLFLDEYSALSAVFALELFGDELGQWANLIEPYADLSSLNGFLLYTSLLSAYALQGTFYWVADFACTYVSGQWPCAPTDGFVPLVNQQWPGANVLFTQGPTHNFSMNSLFVHDRVGDGVSAILQVP